ncbi:MAG: hypothetical protein RIQ56_535 [Candidatus Parcubacteria bacterium]
MITRAIKSGWIWTLLVTFLLIYVVLSRPPLAIEYRKTTHALLAANPLQNIPAESTLMFVGDIMLSREIGNIMQESDNFTFPFKLIEPFLGDADFLFGNLEGPISDRGVKSGSIYSFRADPRATEGLKFAGFDAVSLANNHIWDYGPEALLDTLLYLDDVGIGFSGAGENHESAHEPFYALVGDTRVALLSYTTLLPQSLGSVDSAPAVSLFSEKKTLQEIAEAKTQADIVIVSMHWGNEYETESTQEQKQAARLLVDAGADLVIGHHPHVTQEVEKYKNAYIAYSLGNFVFDQNFSKETKQGLILLATLKGKGVDSVEFKKVFFNENYQPFIASE